MYDGSPSAHAGPRGNSRNTLIVTALYDILIFIKSYHLPAIVTDIVNPIRPIEPFVSGQELDVVAINRLHAEQNGAILIDLDNLCMSTLRTLPCFAIYGG
jgi:hypothetical protein